jgi:hypothetical protein
MLKNSSIVLRDRNSNKEKSLQTKRRLAMSH